MRTETRTVRIGEWMDTEPANVEHWLEVHAAGSLLRRDQRNPPLSDEQQGLVREIARRLAAGERVAVTVNQSTQELYRIGLYDGWVYWRERLCLLTGGTLGAEVREAYNLRSAWTIVHCDGCGLGGHTKHGPLCRGWRRGERIEVTP